MTIRRWLAVAAAALSFNAAAQGADPIRIGLLTADSGTLAFLLPHYLEPAKLAVERINAEGGVMGRKLELVQQAYAPTPAGALQAVTRLAQQEKAVVVFGFITSAGSLAVAPRMEALNAIYLDSTSQANDLTTKACNANYFRSTFNDAMNINTLAAEVRRSGAKTWSLLAADYAYGHDFAKSFKALVESMGGTLNTTLFAPMDTADFGSYISQLDAKRTEGLAGLFPGTGGNNFAKSFKALVESMGGTLNTTLFAPMDTADFGSYISQLDAKRTEGLAVLFPGTGGNNFAKQQKQFGLFPKYKVVVSTSFTADIVLPAQGDTVVGVFSSQGFAPEFTGAKTEAFVKLWQERFKRPPSYIEADTWQAVELIKAAVEKAGGATDPAALRKALAGLKTSTVIGDVEMRAADHQLTRRMALLQVEAAGEGKARMALRAIVPPDQAAPAPVLNCPP